jgi:D-sedoheptulose 7-phosphate isomerase
MNLEKIQQEVDKLIKGPLVERLRSSLKPFYRVLLVGNGGSNTIASHIAVDYVKFLGKQAMACTDAAFITATANDEGVENVFAKFVETHENRGTVVILISSSGNSENIIRAAKCCADRLVPFIILSGFNKHNRLSEFKNKALLSYWVDSDSYGVVENMHQIFLHAVVVN